MTAIFFIPGGSLALSSVWIANLSALLWITLFLVAGLVVLQHIARTLRLSRRVQRIAAALLVAIAASWVLSGYVGAQDILCDFCCPYLPWWMCLI